MKIMSALGRIISGMTTTRLTASDLSKEEIRDSYNVIKRGTVEKIKKTTGNDKKSQRLRWKAASVEPNCRPKLRHRVRHNGTAFVYPRGTK